MSLAGDSGNCMTVVDQVSWRQCDIYGFIFTILSGIVIKRSRLTLINTSPQLNIPHFLSAKTQLP